MGERIKKRWKAVEAHCTAHFSLRLQFFRMTKAVIHKDCEKPSFKTKCIVSQELPLQKVWQNGWYKMVILQYTGEQKRIWTHKSHLKNV